MQLLLAALLALQEPKTLADQVAEAASWIPAEAADAFGAKGQDVELSGST